MLREMAALPILKGVARS